MLNGFCASFDHSVLTFVVPLISALTLNAPTTTPTSGGQTTITWSTSAGDPTSFTLELVNTAFHNTFAISNNLVPSAGSVTLQLPLVPTSYVFFVFFWCDVIDFVVDCDQTEVATLCKPCRSGELFPTFTRLVGILTLFP